MMSRYWSLYVMLLSKQFKTLSLYRFDFFIGVVCLCLSFFSTLFAIWAIFQHTQQIGGWDKNQVTFAYGYNLIVVGFSWLFFNQAWIIRDALISGSFLKYKIRPVNPAFHFFAESLDVKSVVTIILGITILISAINTLDMDIHFSWFLKCIFLISISTAIFSGLIVLVCGLAFWATLSNPLLGFISSIQGLAHFPASIYGKSLFILLSTFVPVVFISFLPCSWLLGKSLEWGNGFYLIAVAFLIWAVALRLWRFGVQRYELPGT
jgi:ABC-2 type transport system permease protein